MIFGVTAYTDHQRRAEIQQQRDAANHLATVNLCLSSAASRLGFENYQQADASGSTLFAAPKERCLSE